MYMQLVSENPRSFEKRIKKERKFSELKETKGKLTSIHIWSINQLTQLNRFKKIIPTTNNKLCRQMTWKSFLCTSMSQTAEYREEQTKQRHFKWASHHSFNLWDNLAWHETGSSCSTHRSIKLWLFSRKVLWKLPQCFSSAPFTGFTIVMKVEIRLWEELC